MQRARLDLGELVHGACRLPSGDPDGPDIDQEVSAPADWPGFGELGVYHEVFDPYVDKPPVCGSLSDDLLDIYRDLRRGFVAYDAGQIADAVWESKFHFDHHWGDHAVDALRALQVRVHSSGGDKLMGSSDVDVITSSLRPLVGLPLSVARRAADLRGFHFGEMRPAGRGNSGAYVLHVQCPWSLEH